MKPGTGVRKAGIAAVFFLGAVLAAAAGPAPPGGPIPDRSIPGPEEGAVPAAAFDLENVPLAAALDLLKAKYGVRWVAREEVLRAARPVTLKGSFTIPGALAEIARQAGVEIKTGGDGVASVAAPGVKGELAPGGTAAIPIDLPSTVGISVNAFAYEALAIDRKGNRLECRLWNPNPSKPRSKASALRHELKRVESGVLEAGEYELAAPLNAKVAYEVIPVPDLPPAAQRGAVAAGRSATIRVGTPSTLTASAMLSPWNNLSIGVEGGRIVVGVAEGPVPMAIYSTPPPPQRKTVQAGPLAPGEYTLEAPAAIGIEYQVTGTAAPASGRVRRGPPSEPRSQTGDPVREVLRPEHVPGETR